MSLRAIIHASEVLTGSGVRKKDGRHVNEADLERIEDGAIVYSERKIEWVGPTSDLPARYKKVRAQNLKQKRCVVPGFVDCHTHTVFAGDRADEFARRSAGVTYAEIAHEGGGIQKTVAATRKASQDELLTLAKARLKRMYEFGVRTVEIKSGYGLSYEDELKTLKVIRALQKEVPQLTLRSTFLGAHDFPKDQTRAAYLELLTERLLPEVSKRKLADACDVFIDEGYYTLAEGRRILTRAKELGLAVKVHADEFINTESAELAAELGALSADHLLKVSPRGIEALAKSQTVAVLLPGTAFFLKAPYAPARRLIDAGACVAISTDFNPGSCHSLSLPFMMTLSALQMGMTRAEIFAGVTYNAAKALGLEKRKGTIERGKDADFAILDVARFEEVYYRVGW